MLKHFPWLASQLRHESVQLKLMLPAVVIFPRGLMRAVSDQNSFQRCTLYVAESVMIAFGASPLSGSVTLSMLSAPIVSDATTKSYSETVPVLVIWRL